jgi:Acyltransferase family
MPQLLTIQAARGFAANLVVLSHLSIVEAKYTRGDVLPACTFYGIAGVDLFFVLSGFIMVAVAGHYTGPVDFLWRRATRIYPTYWLISLPLLALAIVAPLLSTHRFRRPSHCGDILTNSRRDTAFARGRLDACPRTILLFGVLDFSCLTDSDLGRCYWMGRDPLVDSDRVS